MTTVSNRRPRRKPRSVRLTRPIEAERPGVIVITVGGVSHPYTIAPLPGSSTGFRVAKIELVPTEPDEPRKVREAAVYHVDLNGPLSLCCCPGFSRWANCKHVSGLMALRARGLI